MGDEATVYSWGCLAGYVVRVHVTSYLLRAWRGLRAKDVLYTIIMFDWDLLLVIVLYCFVIFGVYINYTTVIMWIKRGINQLADLSPAITTSPYRTS